MDIILDKPPLAHMPDHKCKGVPAERGVQCGDIQLSRLRGTSPNARRDGGPEEIRAEESSCQELLKRLRKAELDLDRNKAMIHMEARARGENSGDSRMIAVRDSGRWQDAVIEAESAYKAAEVILNKKEREFVSLRKVASIKTEELNESRHH